LEHNGEQLYVDVDDVEKTNPSNLDLSKDLRHLKHLNVLHCTKAGPTFIVVNPMAPLSLYSEKVRFLEKKINFSIFTKSFFSLRFLNSLEFF
jgi:hypothetical protein